MSRFVIAALCLVLLLCTSGVRADDSGCYTSGSVAGIVIATVVVTLVMGGLVAAFIWYLWKQRRVGYGDSKSVEKAMVCPPMSPDKQLIAQESNDYAFDNPYFKDDETDTANPDAAEKGETGFRTDNGNLTSSQNSKASNGIPKKTHPFSSLRFHAVFHPSGKKQQQRATMDDTYISKHLERMTVPLRGHDFTGLGFNVCGNMRDGIFVKDVLHRGPASESGKIKAGDRIISLTVSFCSMVYEDALTILSYASPYDVKVEIEKAPVTSTGEPHLPPSSPKRIGTSTSFRSDGQRTLFHPLYRSQSIVDLTQIGKDGFGVMNTSIDSQRESNASATPKRSQSVEAANGVLKTRSAFIMKADETKSTSNKASRKSSTSSCESAGKEAEKTQKASNQKAPCTKVLSARFRPEEAQVKTEATQKAAPPAKPAREIPDVKQPMDNESAEKLAETAIEIPSENATKPQESSAEASGSSEPEQEMEKPTAPPRKTSTPKRKAPAPPPVPPAPPAKTETSAVVHRVDDLPSGNVIKESEATKKEEETSQEPPPPPTTEVPTPDESKILPTELESHENKQPVFASSEKIPEPDLGSSDNSSLASVEHSVSKTDKEDSSPGKRKASSLGDLTKLQNGTQNKTSISSAILERAVSLDLQQSLPGENLVKQKTLRAPAFENDCEEDREDSVDIGSPGLKRWNDGLDKVFTNLPNGDEKHDEETKDDIKYLPQSKLENREVKFPENTLNAEIKEKAKIEITNKIDATDDTIDEMNHKIKTTAVVVAEMNHKTETTGDTVAEIDHKIETTDDTIAETNQNHERQESVDELDVDLDVSFSKDKPLNHCENASVQLTSTPVKRIIEIKNLSKELDDDENCETENSSSENKQTPDELPVKHTVRTSLFSPVTISIPVIKPDLTHYEKLSSPPSNAYTSHDATWKNSSKNSTSDENKTSLERISVQSLYKPIFSTKEIATTEESELDSGIEKMVNGNESDASENYSTAQENTSTSSVDTSSYTVTLATPVISDTPKIPNTIAGFAKTLIIPGPNEVENLLSLANEPNTPPPKLESPVKPFEKE